MLSSLVLHMLSPRIGDEYARITLTKRTMGSHDFCNMTQRSWFSWLQPMRHTKSGQDSSAVLMIIKATPFQTERAVFVKETQGSDLWKFKKCLLFSKTQIFKLSKFTERLILVQSTWWISSFWHLECPEIGHYNAKSLPVPPILQTWVHSWYCS